MVIKVCSLQKYFHLRQRSSARCSTQYSVDLYKRSTYDRGRLIKKCFIYQVGVQVRGKCGGATDLDNRAERVSNFPQATLWAIFFASKIGPIFRDRLTNKFFYFFAPQIAPIIHDRLTNKNFYFFAPKIDLIFHDRPTIKNFYFFGP